MDAQRLEEILKGNPAFETLKARLSPGSRTVSAFEDGTLVALCQMRAGRLEPDRVFNLQ